MRRGLLCALIAGAGLVLTGCATPTPQVTFYAAGRSVDTGPTQYCDLKLTSCTADAKAGVALSVPADRPLQISVPSEVAKTPWVVVFRYQDAHGAAQPDSRSRIFQPGEQYAYTLTLPDPGDKLVAAQVQQLSLVVEQGSDPGAGAEFVTRATWLLTNS